MNKPSTIYIRDYDYPLPQERIAPFPLAKRDDSKLLVYRQGHITDEHFHQLPGLLPQGSLLVVNDTRVIEARILFRKPSGGVIEIFCLEPEDGMIEQSLLRTGPVTWRCLIGGASKWKPGQLLQKTIEG